MHGQPQGWGTSAVSGFYNLQVIGCSPRSNPLIEWPVEVRREVGREVGKSKPLRLANKARCKA